RAYRYSPMRSAHRVLSAADERLGLLTDGSELRLLLRDPARSDSHISVPIAGSAGWRMRSLAPDSFRLVLALGCPKGIAALPELTEAARLSQARVTRDLREQARHAIEGFVQSVLDNPANRQIGDLQQRADELWREALALIYRLLFFLKLESTAESAR